MGGAYGLWSMLPREYQTLGVVELVTEFAYWVDTLLEQWETVDGDTYTTRSSGGGGTHQTSPADCEDRVGDVVCAVVFDTLQLLTHALARHGCSYDRTMPSLGVQN